MDIPDFTPSSKEIKDQTVLIVAEVREVVTAPNTFNRFTEGIQEFEEVENVENVWKIIEKERITGYTHRAPNKKIKKDTISSSVNKESTGCLLINKIVKEQVYPSVNKESSGCLLLNKIIKINTEI